jgi:DtxR family transcriptional regulator, Mn-dependent transcriptional regulator
MRSSTSPAAQDYLKGIFALEQGADDGAPKPVSTKAIAEKMSVSPASATNMLKKLGSMGLVRHAPYRGAELTDAGRKVALEVIRHHRLLETYLAEALGVPWDKVHEEAEILEHVLSDELEDRIAARLGDPVVDPHGHPIPTKDLAMPIASSEVLWQVADGSEARVDRVSDSEAEALRYLARLGIKPGVQLRVIERGPLDGPLFVKVKGGSGEVHALSRELAEAVWVA